MNFTKCKSNQSKEYSIIMSKAYEQTMNQKEKQEQKDQKDQKDQEEQKEKKDQIPKENLPNYRHIMDVFLAQSDGKQVIIHQI